ncbi:MAG TPA: ATP-binding protein [Bryobacteraceae bacterium]|nr:ATP-binding protein [Bryobacteraceae bacterium]
MSTTTSTQHPAGITLAEELRVVPAFSDLPADGLEWLAAQMTVKEYVPGQVVISEGSPADNMVVILGAETRLRVESKSDSATRLFREPTVTGMLPFSRMTQFPITLRAVTPTRLALFPAARFPELLERLPVLGPRLVAVMTDRVREITKSEDQQDKMAALGKISAGLAHELNNPAAAVRRAAGSLREAFKTFRDAAARLNTHDLTARQRMAIPVLEHDLEERATAPAKLDTLERSDCEEAIAECLQEHGVANAWELAPALADAGCEAEWFEGIYAQFPPEALPDLLSRVAASLIVGGLLNEIDNSSGRISELVRAIKEYTYMDQGPEQEVDIHQGLESTLLMLRYRLKHGITVRLDFDRSLPKICAHGTALNQVWTNLIDNAIDAMNGKGELRIRTAGELDRLLVEIADNGSGIPEEIRARVFEPFFTTKGVGQGTGLGLDTAARIVHEHFGEITVQSVPGDTRFQIRLPLPRPTGVTS